MFQMGSHPPAKAPNRLERKGKPATRAPKRSAVTVHLSAEERERFEALGGEAWLRGQLDQHARVGADS